MDTIFLNEVKAALQFTLIRIKHDSPLMKWDSINGKLIYQGNDNDKLIPIHTHPTTMFKKYCK